MIYCEYLEDGAFHGIPIVKTSTDSTKNKCYRYSGNLVKQLFLLVIKMRIYYNMYFSFKRYARDLVMIATGKNLKQIYISKNKYSFCIMLY